MAVRHPTRRNVLGETGGPTQQTVRVRFSADSEFSPATSLGCMLLAVCAGMLLPTQAGMNVKMALFLGHPLRSACMSFLFGTIGLVCINILVPQWKNPQSFSPTANSSSSAVKSPHQSSTSVGVSSDETAQLAGDDLESANGTASDDVPEVMNEPETSVEPPQTSPPQSFDHLNIFEGFVNLMKHLKESTDEPLEYVAVLGGVCGVFYVSMAIYLTPLVGPSVFYISMLLGQLSTSITFDRFGLLWNRTRDLKLVNYFGVLTLFLGVILFNLESFGKLSVKLYMFIIYVLLSILSGICLVVQSSMNKRVRHFLGSPFRAALFSFSVGLSVLVICAFITLGTNSNSTVNNSQHRWYIWFGGLLGMIFVTVSIVVPSVIGFAATFTCVVCGNLSLSMTFDATGAFGFPKESVSALKIVGVLLVISAAIMVNLSADMIASINNKLSTLLTQKNDESKKDTNTI